MEEIEILSKINCAFNFLVDLDIHLIEIDANERSITHKLAQYLTDEFEGWDVDCEYNRDGHEPKRINLETQNIKSDDEKAVTVYPDIIIHRRGTKENLVVIEVKKSSSRDISFDEKKLRLYKVQLRYKHAFLVTLPIFIDPNVIKNLSKFIKSY